MSWAETGSPPQHDTNHSGPAAAGRRRNNDSIGEAL